MDFQSIIILLYLTLFTNLCWSQSGPLTEEENKQRLEKCGLIDSTNPTDLCPWCWLAAYKDPNNPDNATHVLSGASMISPRHFLTSSHSLFTSQKEWMNTTREGFKDEQCIDGTINAEVPPDILPNLMIYRHDCYQYNLTSNITLSPVCKQFQVTANKAYILKICDKNKSFDQFSNAYTPMIVEISGTFDLGFPCLGDRLTTIEMNDTVELYGFGETLDIKELNISSIHDDYLTTFFYSLPDNDGYGSPLVDQNMKIIGITTHNFETIEGRSHNMFQNMKWYQDDFCLLAGICESPATTTTVGPTSTILESLDRIETSTSADPFQNETTLSTTELSLSNETTIEESTTPQMVPNSTTTIPESIDYLHDDRVFKEIENPRHPHDHHEDGEDDGVDYHYHHNGNRSRVMIELIFVLLALLLG